MMCAEKAARLLWCPHARAVEMDGDGDEAVTGYPVGNRSTVDHAHPYCRCIASDCAAWRWMDEGWLHHPDGRGPKQFKTVGDVQAAMDRGFKLVGFCGLSGRPLV